MLSIPIFGWTNVKIGKEEFPASYLTDVPNDCVKAMIYALTNHCDFICSFDAEGWEFKVIADDYKSYIIEEKDEIKLYIYDKNIYILAEELIKDLENNLDDWCDWNMVQEFLPKEEITKNYNDMRRKIQDFKKIIGM